MSVCPTCGQPKKLSDIQRDRYWAMIGNLLQHPKLSHLTRTQLDWYFKDKFLPKQVVTLPSGKVIEQLGSVSRKKGPDVVTMSEYMTKIEALVAEWGVWECEE